MAFWKTIFKGSIGSVETWSTSVSWGVFGLSPDVADQAAADGILAALKAASGVTTLPTSLRTLLSSAGTVDSVRVEQRAEDETVLCVAEGLFTTPLAGSGTASKTPQDAVVLSLRTSTPGPRGRGRMYWPALSASLSTSFQLSSPTATATSIDAKAWLNAIGGAFNTYWTSVGAAKSAVLSVRSVTDHTCRNVNALQVGSVLDTQRRRRDNLPESYVSIAMP